MSKKNFDSEFCGSLPLNNVNLIQDYGYLLVAEKENLKIIQVSENTSELLGSEPEELVELSLPKFLSEKDLTRLQTLIAKNLREKVPLNLTFQSQQIHSALLHVKNDYIILEIEKPGQAEERYFTEVFNELKYSIAAIDTADTVESVSAAAIHELKQISGFDGVLMYRFDKNWNGTVIAEEKTSDLEAYMGQTFPASDIPKQARELYLKNPYRQIPDREYQSHGLYPVINPQTNSFLDLSDCNLRSVPAVHREYMKNMGISASMSIRVIVKNQLWGLISCHHIQPKYTDFEMCAIFEMLSTVISSRITSILYKESTQVSEKLQAVRLGISDQIYGSGSFASSLFNPDSPNVLDMFASTGAILSMGGKICTAGQVPDSSFIEDLMLWIGSKNMSSVFHTDNLQEEFGEAVSQKDAASGMLVLPINPARSEYLICFRPEVQGTIDWGGNPHNSITFDPDGKNYHPRNSFTLWKEKVEFQSEAWTEMELEAANALSAFLSQFRIKLSGA